MIFILDCFDVRIHIVQLIQIVLLNLYFDIKFHIVQFIMLIIHIQFIIYHMVYCSYICASVHVCMKRHSCNCFICVEIFDTK